MKIHIQFLNRAKNVNEGLYESEADFTAKNPGATIVGKDGLRIKMSIKSGVPHVYWHNHHNQWLVSGNKGGKTKYFGFFRKLGAAKKHAEKMFA